VILRLCDYINESSLEDTQHLTSMYDGITKLSSLISKNFVRFSPKCLNFVFSSKMANFVISSVFRQNKIPGVLNNLNTTDHVNNNNNQNITDHLNDINNQNTTDPRDSLCVNDFPALSERERRNNHC